MSAGGDWPVVSLSDVLTDIQTGFASGKNNSTGQGVAHLRPMNVSTNGQIDRSLLKFVAADVASGATRRLSRGDVLFNNTNSPELVGKTALFDDEDEPAYSNHMTRLRVDPTRVDPGFLALRLHQLWREGWFAAHCNNHVSQASIGRDVLRGLTLALPSVAVQRRIYSLAQLAQQRQLSCSAHLDAATHITRRFRSAVLAAACCGRLTADWREARTSPDTLPRELADPSTTGTKPGARRRKLDDRPRPDVELPETWAWVRLSQIATSIEYGFTAPSTPEAVGPKLLRITDIQDEAVDWDGVPYCVIPDAKITGYRLAQGDLVFARTGATTGKSFLIRETPPDAVFASYLIRVRLADGVLPGYVYAFFRSLVYWQQITDVSTGTGQPNVNGTKLASLWIPLPGHDEQAEIARRAESVLAAADRLSSRVTAAERQVGVSSRSILAKAFRGELAAAMNGGS